MNWGNKIVVAFVLFAAFILYMVVQAFQQNNDLVADDYYAQEINYQVKLEQMANLKRLGEKATIEQVGEKIIVTFPEGQELSGGELHFYHLSRQLLDKKIPIEADERNQQVIDRKQLVTSQYHVNISWEADGEKYFQQEKITIR